VNQVEKLYNLREDVIAEANLGGGVAPVQAARIIATGRRDAGGGLAVADA
jgi:hypothetical protein